MRPVFRAIFSPKEILGALIFLLLAGALYAAQGEGQSYYVGAADHRQQNMIELFQNEEFTITANYNLTDQMNAAETIIRKSITNDFDIGLIVSLCKFESEYFPADQRIYQFNIDNGFMYPESSLPPVWEDLNRLFTVLVWVKTGYPDGDIKDIVGFYLFGQRHCGELGYEGLNDEMKSDVDLVISEGERYSELIQKVRGATILDVTAENGEVTVEVKEPFYPDYGTYTSDEISEAYISVMLYYNPNLDHEIASDIVDAIAYNKRDPELFPDVDSRFVMALIANESGFNPEAVSHVGAMGLGQLMPFTAEKYGVDDPFDVTENIRVIFEYLQNEFNRWEGKDKIYDYVIASYNAGAGAVSKYNGIPPYEETVNYVYRVTRVFKNFLNENEYEYLIYGKSKHYPDGPE